MKKYVPILQVLLFLFMLVFLIHYLRNKRDWRDIAIGMERNVQTEKQVTQEEPAEWQEESLDDIEQMETVQPATIIQEENIYSFLQGPQSWSGGVSWSGEWCRFEVDGNSFGGFGCGLCCMANVYDTLSPYEVSPWDMYENAKIASDYKPGGEYGAIDWEEMRCALEVCGISGELHKKPETYEEFQEQIREAKSAIVLVNSGDDNTFWQTTQGHYVNIWLYQEDDTVFLADPGNREKNRTRIPLRYVYDALKMASRFQYLTVQDYVEADNRWRADGIDEDWCRPGI